MGRIRIIAGALGGRRIDFPDETGLRPTPDRAREALFSILGETVRGASVVDPYAGSGALGFEALSRGAASVWFIESNPRSLDAIRANASRLGVSAGCRFEKGDGPVILSRGGGGGPFDLVLADPPYDSGEPLRLLAAAAGGILAPGGRVVLELRSSSPGLEPPEGLALSRSARYGDTRFDFFVLKGASDPFSAPG